ADLPDEPLAAVLISNPGTSGRLIDAEPVITRAHERGALAVVIVDLLSLALVTPPGAEGLIPLRILNSDS
ncbi:MAG: hypothetical protein ACO2YV_10345, partial [Pseudomonadales bacterium]